MIYYWWPQYAVIIITNQLIILYVHYGDGIGNTVKEYSSMFSIKW